MYSCFVITHFCSASKKFHCGVSLIKPSFDRASTAVDCLVVAVELDLHGPVLELGAVETLIAAWACSRVSKSTVPQPLERPVSAWQTASALITVPTCWNTCLRSSLVVDQEVANDDLEAGGRLGATRVGTAGLVRAARALEAHDDGAALEVGVVEGVDGAVGRVGRLKVDETPALGPAAGLLGNLGLDDRADLGAVGCWERGTRGGGRGQRVTNSVKENSTQSKKGRERFRRQEPGAPGSSRAGGGAGTTRIGSIGVSG